MGNCVYAFQSPRVSSLFRDTDCLLYSGKLCLCISVTRSVFIILGHRLSTLLWDKDCLHCSGTWSPKEDKVSTLLCHRECLLCYGICLHYYGIASSLVCQSDLSTLVCLVSSLVLAPSKKPSLLVLKRTFFQLFKFDGWYFWNHWEIRDVMYLI